MLLVAVVLDAETPGVPVDGILLSETGAMVGGRGYV